MFHYHSEKQFVSLRAVRNKLKIKWTKEKVFDSLFLGILCIIYSIAAIFNLGNLDAPQTFYRFEAGTEIAVKLSRKVSNPLLVFYSGITENDFELSHLSIRDSNAVFENSEKNYTTDYFSGPFRWLKIRVSGEAEKIVLKNTAGRDIDIGEMAVFDGDEKIDVEIYRFDYGQDIGSTDDFLVLSDEQELIARDSTISNSTYFDELYFAQTAYQYATEQRGYETVHPPLGKIIQSIPIKLTGRMTPFSWRIMGTLTGTFIIIAVYFLAKEIFGKASFARVAAIIVALSGLHLTQTRVGTVDSYLCLFTVLEFLFMMKFLNTKKLRFFILAGIFFGCGFSVKWSGAFGGIGLLIMLIIFMTENKLWKKKEIMKWIFHGLAFFVFVPLAIYCSSYLLFPKTTGAHSLGDVWNQSVNLYTYHKDETTPHPYSSMWYTWPIALKPMLYVSDTETGQRIYLMANYVIAYVSIIGLFITAYFAIRKKDRTSMIILFSWLGLLLPYALIHRTMFLYHYLPASIFAIIATTNIFHKIPGTRKTIPLFLLLALISFIISFPKMTGI